MKHLELNTVNALVAFALNEHPTLDEAREAYELVAHPMRDSLMDMASYHEFSDWENELIDTVFWDADYIIQNSYKEDNEPKIREFFHERIEGKAWEEIDSADWDFYSDWHKDVFGYRPHGIVCGEYIKPW